MKTRFVILSHMITMIVVANKLITDIVDIGHLKLEKRLFFFMMVAFSNVVAWRLPDGGGNYSSSVAPAQQTLVEIGIRNLIRNWLKSPSRHVYHPAFLSPLDL